MFFNKGGDAILHEALDELRASGCRITAPRRAVIQTLIGSPGWLRPEAIHEHAQRTAPSLSLVTVYRTLQLLTELGIARRVHTDDGCQGYHLAKHNHGHHLICRGCQGVIEFPGTEDLRPLIEHLEAVTGFVIEEHVLELSGLCPGCQT